MNGSEAVTTILNRVSRQTNPSTNLSTWIYSELNLAKNRLEAAPELPWFLLTEEAYQSITQGEERIAIPSDFLRETDTDNMQVEDTEATPSSFYDLRKVQFDDARTRYGDTTGRPEVYVLSGGYFRVRPIPDKTTYRLWMTYFAKDEDVTQTSAGRWLTYMPDLLIAEAGIVIATALRNDQAAALFTGLRKTEMDRLVRENVAREMVNFQSNPED